MRNDPAFAIASLSVGLVVPAVLPARAQEIADQRLTQSEIDAFRAQVERCWNLPADALNAKNLEVKVQVNLNRNGTVDGEPDIIDDGGGSVIARAVAESGRRAVVKCAPYNLPPEKYSGWETIVLTFTPTF